MKYLGIRIDSKLDWKAYIDDIALKLIRANAMLYKVRDFVNVGILKAIYHAQKQPTRGVPRKRCSENIQQIYRRTPMPKCGFNNVALRSGCFMCYLSHIFIRRGLYGNRMYTKPVVFSYFKRNHQDWFILKNVISILILSFSNQKWWNSLIKLKLKIVFTSANCQQKINSRL